MRLFALFLLVVVSKEVISQNKSTVKEYTRVFATYPYSDPNPVPDPGAAIYPYFRFDGFTNKPSRKEWKVVELENDFIKVTILPEIGGKIWSGIEKKTGKEFLYNNPVVKFRDVSMRGPWTSGGIEANYGIIGHTPNCATPVDYITTHKDDGSASCTIGVLDLLTQTNWRLEINLPKDKAYFTTKSFWYNTTPLEQPYYSWMNTGIKAKGNLEFIYPGTHYLGHEGEYNDWPINRSNGKNISFYEQNDFGSYKSYHVFGTHADFFGAYWHQDDYGMVRYSTRDDKAGKKIWIWGLSRQGMIWEKLLTDGGGQYVEVQSGRLFNQSASASINSPFKYRSFFPNETDTWIEYWYPVVQTKGLVTANEFGALNVRKENGWLKINFCPLQNTTTNLRVNASGKEYNRTIALVPLQSYADSVPIDTRDTAWTVSIGDKIAYSHMGFGDATLSRPLKAPKDFNWENTYGLFLAGKSLMEQRQYEPAAEKINACLKTDPNYSPALVALSELEYRKMNYEGAFNAALKAMSVNTYDPGANYYYGLAALKLNKIPDAKDGFELASQSAEYRVPAFTQLAFIYFKEKQWERSLSYAGKSLEFNHYNLTALQLQALIYRRAGDTGMYRKTISLIDKADPLNHFVLFEKYFQNPSPDAGKRFISSLRNELPAETCLELALWYHSVDCVEEMKSLLELSPPGEEVAIWRNCFSVKNDLLSAVQFSSAFPFRAETAALLEEKIKTDNSWKWKYALALIYAGNKNREKANHFFSACGNEPIDAGFYGSRAGWIKENAEADLKKAISLDKNQWRYQKWLSEYYIQHGQHEKALAVAETFYLSHKEHYIMGMLYARTLLLNRRYKDCDLLLSDIQIIPFEGATDGRILYRESKLQQALALMQRAAYQKALPFINSAEGWPENLGVGKPYEADIDTRLEDWMRFLCYQKSTNAREANKYLQKIISFTPRIENTVSNFFPSNHLVTAWAMEKAIGRNEALRWLNNEMIKYPDDAILPWVKANFESGGSTTADRKDANISMLTALIGLK